MQNDISSHIRRCVALMLEPIVDFCLSRGLRIQDFIEIAKSCYVRSAEQKLKAEGRDISISKICIMSGIQRPEIGRLRSAEAPVRQKDFIARVVGQWIGDKLFQDKKKKPRPLSTEGARSEFAKLVATVSKDLNPHTVRFEMERIGVVAHENGYATLTQPAYITNGDPLETLKFIGEDSRDLLAAIQENALTSNYVPNLHARTTYDNIPDEFIPEIREWLLQLGQRVHEESRQYLARFDRDITHARTEAGTGRNRVVLGTFSRVEPVDEEEKESE